MEGSDTYTGATTVDSSATLSGAAGANVFSAASATTVNGTLDLGGNAQTASSLAGAGTVTNSGASGTATLTNQGASLEFDGVTQDGATAVTALTQNAPLNTLTLTGANTYTGATTITAGTRALSGTGGIANSSGVSLATGAVFDISQTTAGASIETLGNTTAGQTGTVYLGAETLTLTGALTTAPSSAGTWRWKKLCEAAINGVSVFPGGDGRPPPQPVVLKRTVAGPPRLISKLNCLPSNWPPMSTSNSLGVIVWV